MHTGGSQTANPFPRTNIAAPPAYQDRAAPLVFLTPKDTITQPNPAAERYSACDRFMLQNQNISVVSIIIHEAGSGGALQSPRNTFKRLCSGMCRYISVYTRPGGRCCPGQSLHNACYVVTRSSIGPPMKCGFIWRRLRRDPPKPAFAQCFHLFRTRLRIYIISIGQTAVLIADFCPKKPVLKLLPAQRTASAVNTGQTLH